MPEPDLSKLLSVVRRAAGTPLFLLERAVVRGPGGVPMAAMTIRPLAPGTQLPPTLYVAELVLLGEIEIKLGPVVSPA